MLVVISDLHVTDGSSGTTISERAFKIFRERLREMAYEASWRAGGSYRPIEKMDVLLLGDVMDVIRSAKWLDEEVRPWNDVHSPEFLTMVKKINLGILSHNSASFAVLKGLNSADRSLRITLPPDDGAGNVTKIGYEPETEGRISVEVNIHYMVGNHDWFYHLQGDEYNEIRQTVIDAMGLANDSLAPFAHDPAESSMIMNVLNDHDVYARHGDIYDPFNYEGNRDASSLGDAIVVELLNRFPLEVRNQLGDQLPVECLEGLNEIDNVRPLLLIPVWVDALLDKTCSNQPDLAHKVKDIWNNLATDFLKLDFVRKRDKWWNPLDAVDKLELGLIITSKISFDKIAGVIKWFTKKKNGSVETYYQHTSEEQAVKDKKAFIVYGHTHHSEVVPLDNVNSKDQIYINSGTWRAVYEMAKADYKLPRFVNYKVMTYLAFFKGDERGGRKFESWSGSLG
jgi:UDP-2,3-diacylglucosamine pyrophosphatase LpxH